MRTLRRVQIKGFKSIAEADITLGDLNVVIGANGSGKSNLIGAFRLLERVLSHNLQGYVAGDPDRLLHHGRKVTKLLTMDFAFDRNAYGFSLMPVQDGLAFASERVEYSGFWEYGESIGTGHRESKLEEAAANYKNKIPRHVFPKVRDLTVHHFHDTSDSAPSKQAGPVSDNRALRPDAANLAAFLYWMQEKQPVVFRQIEEHVRLVAPFFDRFDLAPSKLNDKNIKLEWRQKASEAYFDGYSLSDGTLRFICLATLLLQPAPPALILLDEPELGLHPYAIRILAELLEAAAKRSQVLLATQSVTLLNHFSPADVLVAENQQGATTFTRPDAQKLEHWLDEFSLGELWEKNVIGGRP
jgi:predicted ATPase